MESDFLTLHSAKAEHAPNVQAIPSAGIEFAYAYFSLFRTQKLPWFDVLLDQAPELPKKLRDFWQEKSEIDLDLLYLIAECGYIFDASLGRFLDDLEFHLPEFFKRLEQLESSLEQRNAEKELKSCQSLSKRLERLQNHPDRTHYLGLLRQLWAVLEPLWLAEGLALAETASTRFNQQFALQMIFCSHCQHTILCSLKNPNNILKKPCSTVLWSWFRSILLRVEVLALMPTTSTLLGTAFAAKIRTTP